MPSHRKNKHNKLFGPVAGIVAITALGSVGFKAASSLHSNNEVSQAEGAQIQAILHATTQTIGKNILRLAATHQKDLYNLPVVSQMPDRNIKGGTLLGVDLPDGSSISVAMRSKHGHLDPTSIYLADIKAMNGLQQPVGSNEIIISDTAIGNSGSPDILFAQELKRQLSNSVLSDASKLSANDSDIYSSSKAGQNLAYTESLARTALDNTQQILEQAQNK